MERKPNYCTSSSGKHVGNLLVWDAEGPPAATTGTTVLWRAFSAGKPCNHISIPQLIEENADTLRQRYLAWLYELGETRYQDRRLIDHFQLRPGFSYWWMTLIAESSYFKSPHLVDAIGMFALTNWASDRTIDGITLVSPNQPLAECVRLWCKKIGAPFEWQRLPKPSVYVSWGQRVFSVLPTAIQALMCLTHYLIDRWPLHGVGLNEWQQTEGRTTFISYLFNLSPDSVKSGRHESIYWTLLPGCLRGYDKKINWLHLYVKDDVLPNADKAAETIRKINKTALGTQTHITLDAFLTARVVLKALSDWARLAWIGRRLQRLIHSTKESRLDLWPLVEEDWRQSTCGATAITNALNLGLFEAAITSLPQQEVGVYPQENQGWEFALIQAWKTSGKGRLIGSPHSSVRFWDLRYFFDRRSYQRIGDNLLPLPDQVALNGKAATDAYLTGGYPAEFLVEVEALRYLYLANDNTRRVANYTASPNCLRLLVLGDYLPRNTRSQMRLLEEFARSFPKSIVITVKPHPACPVRAEDYPKLRMTIVNEPLEKLLNDCNVAYAGAVTSAAVDAYCAGVPVVSVLDATTLNLSPLRGREGVYFIQTSDELCRVLASIPSSSGAVAVKTDFFTIDSGLPRWRELLLRAP